MYGIEGLPLIREGDNLGEMIVVACKHMRLDICDGDIIVVAQKVVSKSEGAVLDLKTVDVSPEAMELADKTGRDPRMCQVYLNESRRIVRVKGRMVITIHRLGFECSSAGVDRSNVAASDEEIVVLLPRAPDASAARIRQEIGECIGKRVAVIINDSFGRRDRDGSIGMAIGLAGISHLELRAQHDLFGNTSNSRIAMVDELAAAASILMGQADESTPVVLIRGVDFTEDEEASIQGLLIQEE